MRKAEKVKEYWLVEIRDERLLFRSQKDMLTEVIARIKGTIGAWDDEPSAVTIRKYIRAKKYKEALDIYNNYVEGCDSLYFVYMKIALRSPRKKQPTQRSR